MKPHVALTALLLTLAGVTAAHLDIEPRDNGWLLLVDGRAHDVLGLANETWNRVLRRCGAVQPVGEGALHDAALAAVRSYSPPDSASARLLQLRRDEGWLLAEVEFDRLFPAVVLLRQTAPADSAAGPVPGHWQIDDRAIWSGMTHPWKAAPLIRQYIGTRAPDAPARLLQCFEPMAGGLR